MATTTSSAAESSFVPVVAEYIAVTAGHCGGKPHVAGHRVKVQHIAIWHERMGMSPEEIVATYPTLSLAQVHAALAYYFGNRAQIDADIQADEEYAARQRESTPSLLQQYLAERQSTSES